MPLSDWSYDGCVERVIDGDTIVAILDLGFHVRVSVHLRLEGVYAPEPYGDEKDAGIRAREMLEGMLPCGCAITVHTGKLRSFNRWIAVVWRNGSNINDAINQLLAP